MILIIFKYILKLEKDDIHINVNEQFYLRLLIKIYNMKINNFIYPVG